MPDLPFAIGDRVRFVALSHPESIGRLGTVVSVPKVQASSVGHIGRLRGPWASMRVRFDGDEHPSKVWPDQFEHVSIVDRIGELGP